MVGETGSGKTTQYARILSNWGYFVTDFVQDTTIRCLLRYASNEEENGCMHTATPRGCHVCSEACR